jgi:hypothetical protein
VQQRDERAAAREPDGGLAGRVASTNHGDTFGAAELRLGRPGGVEDAHALVSGEPLNRQAAVLRASRERDCKRPAPACPPSAVLSMISVSSPSDVP